VGEDSEANEELVLSHQKRHPDCLWLHAVGAVGSHVVCCLEGKEKIPFPVLQKAGRLAIEYSRSRDILVRFAKLSNVYKPAGCEIGQFQATAYRVFKI